MDDLRKQPDLTFQQIVGLKYFKELEVKISREEMDIWNVFSLLGNSDDRLPSKPQPKLSIPISSAP